MGIGEAAGYNYAIPQKFIGRQPQQVQQAPDLPADDSDFSDVKQGDYLAHVEGLTDKYYSTAGLLKDFAQEQRKKGIDVTQPDYSQPGGGELFKTYQKLAAVLKHTANDLANSNDIDKTMQKLQAEGKVTQNPGFDPRQQMSATMSPNQMYTSTDLNQTTQNAATDLGQAYYTNADAQAKNQTVRNPLIDFYQKRMQEDPGNAQYYANQIAALPQATAQTAYQQLIPRGGRGGRTQQDFLDRAELIKSIKAGIINNDQTPINVLKQVPGVESVDYVNDGDRTGIEVYYKGSNQPSFIDLQSPDGGTGEINVMINRLKGQQQIPNEKTTEFDTEVKLPKSKAKAFLYSLKTAVGSLNPEAINQLNSVVQKSELYTPEDEKVISVEATKNWPWQDPNRLTVSYYKNDAKGNPTSKVVTKNIDLSENPEWLDKLISGNATTIANSLGAGFETEGESDAKAKAAELLKKYSK